MVLNVNEVVVGVSTLIFGVHTFIWALFHCSKMYSDLYTQERASVSHRKSAPKINKIYKSMSWLTTMGIAGFAFVNMNNAINSNFTKPGPGCYIVAAMGIAGWQTGKTGMFLSYILRLHQCYGSSAFGYAEKKLICFSVFITILSVILWLSIVIGSLFGEYSYIDADGEYPYLCYIGVHPQFGLVIGGSILLFDVIMTIGSIFAFTIPINRLRKTLAITNENINPNVNDSKSIKKMLYTGYKYKVIVICASITSIFWILLSIAGQPFLLKLFAMIDFTINMFCLMFMTPYYPDSKYYRRFCYLCICCCDRKKQSYEKGEENNESVSTMPNKQTITITEDTKKKQDDAEFEIIYTNNAKDVKDDDEYIDPKLTNPTMSNNDD